MDVELTTLSRNGQIVLPKRIRDRLRLRPGETLIASAVGDRVVLVPARSEALRAEFEEAVAEFDKGLRRAGRAVDAVELVRRLRARAGGS